MTTYDPKKVRPKDGWALLLEEQREEKLASGIVLPIETGAEKVTELAGTLIRLGGGDYCDALRKQGLEPGVRVLYRGFLKYANPLPTDEAWSDGKAKRFFFVDCKDILGIVGEGVKVGVFSGRPTVPHIQPKENS